MLFADQSFHIHANSAAAGSCAGSMAACSSHFLGSFRKLTARDFL
jgi:hypothetical protein